MTGVETGLWLVGACAAGGAVGCAYFAGLWATVRALPSARRPASLVFISFTVRLAAAVAAFGLLARAGGWPWTASALAGFLIARTALVRRLRATPAPAGGAA